jgi:hypothetical protein
MGCAVATALLALQLPQGSLLGTVRDAASQQPLVGAVVILGDHDRATSTDARGRYRFERIPAGPHHLAVRSVGYRPRTLHGLVPREGAVQIDVSLERMAVQLLPLETRAPVAEPAVDEAHLAFPDHRASITAVRNDPLLAEPDVLLALRAEGATAAPEAPDGLHVLGGAADQTGYLLDGIPVLSPHHPAGLFSAWNPDAIASLRLEATAPSPSGPDVLSGVVSAATRPPGPVLRVQAGLSTTQGRATVDGPLGGSIGFLASWRAGFPGLLAPRRERSYLDGESGDWLAKLEGRALGGRFRVLGYGNTDEVSALTRAEPTGPIDRHRFEWSSRSLGAEWVRPQGQWTTRVLGWSATSHPAATWGTVDAGPIWRLTSGRRDLGVLGSLSRRSAASAVTVGFRFQSIATSYRVVSDSAAFAVDASLPAATVFLESSRALGQRLRLDAAIAATGATARWYLGPRATIRWLPVDRVTMSGSYSRLHQFAQSLRNPESVVGAIFPIDLSLGAGAGGVPVGTSDQVALTIDYHPRPGARLGARAFHRRLGGLVLVAPGTAEPFAAGPVDGGAGRVDGIGLTARLQGARLGLSGDYRWQRVRWSARGRADYQPEHGASHSLDAGLIVFTSGTSSFRVGATAMAGRRSTPILGGFEWESCNLLDRGCEFVGTPRADRHALGSLILPAYLRLDLGFRKHWHLRVAGREVEVAGFGTVTNLLGRRNVLTRAPDPLTGDPTAVEMRPRAPLVIGLDWRF